METEDLVPHFSNQVFLLSADHLRSLIRQPQLLNFFSQLLVGLFGADSNVECRIFGSLFDKQVLGLLVERPVALSSLFLASELALLREVVGLDSVELRVLMTLAALRPRR